MRVLSCLAAIGGVAVCVAACGLGTNGLQDMPADGGPNDGPFSEGTSSGSSGGGEAGMTDSPSPEGSSKDQSSPDSPTMDVVTSNDGPTETSTTCTTGAGCYIIPAGWSLVAFAPNQGTSCPNGFGGAGATKLVEAPDTGNACACAACSIGTQPTCDVGAIGSYFDIHMAVGNNCGQNGLPPQLANNPAGACDTDLNTMAPYNGLDLKFVAPGPSGGQCTSNGQPTGNLSYGGHDTECTPDSNQAAGCTGTQCTPGLISPYLPCVVQTGSVSCPGAPFTVRHDVGTSGSLTCGDCGCNVSANCGGRVEFFTDGNCMNNEFDMGADGVCRAGPGGVGTTFGSYKYVGNNPTSVGCGATGSSAASVTLVGEETICCTQ